MGFMPPDSIDASAVFGNLRANTANNFHAGERVLNTLLESSADIALKSAVATDRFILSAVELGQSVVSAKSAGDVWHSISDHSVRVHEAYFQFVHDCFACRHRALDKLAAEK